jgi:hypothetical protein
MNVVSLVQGLHMARDGDPRTCHLLTMTEQTHLKAKIKAQQKINVLKEICDA